MYISLFVISLGIFSQDNNIFSEANPYSNLKMLESIINSWIVNLLRLLILKKVKYTQNDL